MTQTTLYRFFDAEDRLLYVGITGRSLARWAEHSKVKPWWPQVVRTTLEHHPDRQAALDAERRAIVAEGPVHNIVHACAGGAPKFEVVRPAAPTTYPVEVGQVVVVKCEGRDYPPVGYVDEVHDLGFKLALYSFGTYEFGHRVELIRWADVLELAWVPVLRTEGRTRVFDMDIAADAQRRWTPGRTTAHLTTTEHQ